MPNEEDFWKNIPDDTKNCIFSKEDLDSTYRMFEDYFNTYWRPLVDADQEELLEEDDRLLEEDMLYVWFDGDQNWEWFNFGSRKAKDDVNQGSR